MSKEFIYILGTKVTTLQLNSLLHEWYVKFYQSAMGVGTVTFL